MPVVTTTNPGFDDYGFRAIKSPGDLSGIEAYRIKQMVQEAIKISEPKVEVNDVHMKITFKSVFASD